MKLFRLIQQQQLPGSIETAWDFFSTTENLDKITPPDMEFKILTGAGQRAFEGQIITYRIKPIFNIPMHWVTEITHLRELEYFVDEQRIGPYRFWHHLHRFTPKDNGVFMEDVLDYALPTVCLVNSWVNGLFTSGSRIFLLIASKSWIRYSTLLTQQLIGSQYQKHKISSSATHYIFGLLPEVRPFF